MPFYFLYPEPAESSPQPPPVWILYHSSHDSENKQLSFLWTALKCWHFLLEKVTLLRYRIEFKLFHIQSVILRIKSQCSKRIMTLLRYSEKHNSAAFVFGSISYKNYKFQVLVLTIYLLLPYTIKLFAAKKLLSHKNKLITQTYLKPLCSL